MSNLVITNIDLGDIEIGESVKQDETLRFAAADTFAPGTLLARKVVSGTITVTPDGGNTGTRELSATAHAGKTLQVGTYTLTAGTLSSGLGPWTLVAPDGQSEVFTTTGGAADDDLVFSELGLTVVVAATGTNFVTGDSADVVTTAGNELVPFLPTGTNGEQEPMAVMQYEVTRASGGVLAIRPIVAGRVNKNRLLIDADGDGDNITPAILDKLRANGVIAEDVRQLSGVDNQ
jgi:hypothetical protein